jgi:uncharacterized protein (DUF1697 family)
MPRYVAFLRAINVGGHVVKMDRLRSLFEAIKLSSVETFIASGNVIFESSNKDALKLEALIEKHLRQSLSYEVATFIRSDTELAAISAQDPFKGEETNEEHALYILFLRNPLSKSESELLTKLRGEVDEFHLRDREIYWLRRKKLTDPAYPAPALEKALKLVMTSRNANTVRKISAKYPSRTP